jgi:hypothetical protein
MILESIEDINLAWLKKALGSEAITDFSMERIGEGVGLMGMIVRVDLKHSEPQLPETVIVKIQTTDEQNLVVAATYDSYGREVDFYNHLAQECPLPTPRVFTTACNDDRNQFTLILEDLSAYDAVDQLIGPNSHQVMLCMQNLARLHGEFWGKTDESRFDWMYDFRAAYQPVAESYPGMLEICLEISSKSIPNSTRDFLRVHANTYLDKLHRFTELETFVHGDFRLDNMFFSKDGNDFRMIDWGNNGRCSPMWDLSYFLSTNIDTEMRRTIERQAIEVYHDQLMQSGVKNYSQDQCWRDYIWGLPYAFYVPVIVLSSMGAGNERGDELAQTLFSRSIDAMTDHHDPLQGLVL